MLEINPKTSGFGLKRALIWPSDCEEHLRQARPDDSTAMNHRSFFANWHSGRHTEKNTNDLDMSIVGRLLGTNHLDSHCSEGKPGAVLDPVQKAFDLRNPALHDSQKYIKRV